jgi:hypothetical protein
MAVWALHVRELGFSVRRRRHSDCNSVQLGNTVKDENDVHVLRNVSPLKSQLKSIRLRDIEDECVR